MVCCVWSADILVVLTIAVERCIFRNLWYTLRDIQTYEQHGRKTRMPLAMVYRVSCGGFLVFYRGVVVSTVI